MPPALRLAGSLADETTTQFRASPPVEARDQSSQSMRRPIRLRVYSALHDEAAVRATVDPSAMTIQIQRSIDGEARALHPPTTRRRDTSRAAQDHDRYQI